MTNHFSQKVSLALRAIGVEGETEKQWGKSAYSGQYLCTSKEERIVRSQHEYADEPGAMDIYDLIPAYTLHDILRLMPKIGEKIYKPWQIQEREIDNAAKLLCFEFMEGDYPAAEKYLMSLLMRVTWVCRKHHAKMDKEKRIQEESNFYPQQIPYNFPDWNKLK